MHVVCKDKDAASRVLSQLKMIIRANISSPPIHGARIAERVLAKAENFQQWQAELKEVAERIISMRYALRNHLEEMKTPGILFVYLRNMESYNRSNWNVLIHWIE